MIDDAEERKLLSCRIKSGFTNTLLYILVAAMVIGYLVAVWYGMNLVIQSIWNEDTGFTMFMIGVAEGIVAFFGAVILKDSGRNAHLASFNMRGFYIGFGVFLLGLVPLVIDAVIAIAQIISGALMIAGYVILSIFVAWHAIWVWCEYDKLKFAVRKKEGMSHDSMGP